MMATIYRKGGRWRKDELAVVKYSVLNDKKQLFTSKYKLTLPSEEELKLEIERERLKLEKYVLRTRNKFKLTYFNHSVRYLFG